MYYKQLTLTTIIALILTTIVVCAETKIKTDYSAGKNSTTKKISDISSRSGVTYKHCEIMSIEPDGITVLHDTGISKIPFTELSTKLQTRYGYDPMKAAKYSKDQATIRHKDAIRRQKNAKKERVKLAKKRRDQKLLRLVASIRKHKHFLKGKVIQVLEKGVLFYPKQNVTAKGEPVLLVGIGTDLYDGSHWSGNVYPAGRYQYTSVNGSIKTIKRFAISPELAVQVQYNNQ